MISQRNFTKTKEVNRESPNIPTFYSKPIFKSGFDLRLYYLLIAGILLIPVFGIVGFPEISLVIAIGSIGLFTYILISPYERFNCQVVVYEDHFRVQYLLNPKLSARFNFEHIEGNVLLTKQERLYNEISDLNFSYKYCIQKLTIPMRKPTNEVLKIREIITNQVVQNASRWN